jgi:hypothetical protein
MDENIGINMLVYGSTVESVKFEGKRTNNVYIYLDEKDDCLL